MHIYGISKDGNDNPVCKTAKETQRYTAVFWTLWERAMIWENSIETCIIYVKRIASPGSMHDTGCSPLVHWDDPEGWDKEEGGRGFPRREHVYTRGEFMLMCSKTKTI